MRKLVCALLAALALCIFSFAAVAETKTFVSPIFAGYLLDWCVSWGTGCGADAATAWCKTEDFEAATDVRRAADIGAATPTKLISTGEICDKSYCDGFSFITCARVDPPPPEPIEITTEPAPPPVTAPVVEAAEETFENPQFNDIRLNWCFDGKAGCGKRAADAWCVQREFKSAKNFESIKGIRSTIQIGTGKTKKAAGRAFRRITCVR